MTAFRKAHRSRLNALFEELQKQGVTASSDALGNAALRFLRERAAEGDSAAETDIHTVASEGFKSAARRFLKKDTGRIVHLHNGKRTTAKIPTRLGVRQRRADGTIAPNWTLPLWWAMSWTVFAEGVEMLRRQGNILLKEVAAFDAVLVLRDKHPETRTPLDACEIEGFDPRELDIAGKNAA